MLLQKPDNLNREDTRARFEERFTPEERNLLTEVFEKTRNDGFAHFINSFSTYTPSMFIVISYQKS